MTKVLVGNIGSYTFDASAKTITLSGLPTLDIEQLLLITNVKNGSNEIIYQFDLPAKSGTIAANVITLTYDTTAMNDTNPLQIWVDLPSSSAGAINTKIEGDTSGNIAEVNDEKRLKVESKQTYENASLSAFGLPIVAQNGVVQQFRYTNASINSDLIKSTTGSGSIDLSDNSALRLNTGAATNSSAKVFTKEIHKYTSGIGNRGQQSIILGDTGVAGNIREWGYLSKDEQNGCFFRLNGTVLSFVLKSGGTEVAEVTSNNWDSPPTLNANGNLWYIQYEWQGVGNFYLYYQQQLVHTYIFQGTSTVPSMETPDLPFYYKNQNTTNNTNVILKNPCSVMMSEGRQITELSDSDNIKLKFSSDNRIRTEAFGSILASENFANNVFNTTNKWVETIVSGGSRSVTDSILSLNTDTTATSSITEKLINTGLQESVGAICQYNARYSFGATQQANNIREWGYLDVGLNDGVLFRLNNATLYLVFIKNGVETTQDITSVKPDSGFHTYIIEQLGVDTFYIYINDQKVYSSIGTALVGNKTKVPYFRNYNTGALGGTPSASEIDWFTLLDSSGSSTVIVGKDLDGIPREAAFDSSGNLKTITVITAPPDTTPITIVQQSSTTLADNFYTITNGKTLTIQRLSGGCQPSVSGSVIELFYAPNGNTTGIVLIEDIYCQGASDQKDLAAEYIGDGTAAILLRRRVFGGGAVQITGRWQGYE